jgi:cell division protein FtsB
MSLGGSFGSVAVRGCSFLGGVLVIGFVGAALFGDDGVARHERLREDLRQVQALNADLTQENKRLLLEARALKNDPDFLESVIRDELGWVRSDELVFIFPSERAP